MRRYLLPIAAGLVLGGLVHLLSTLALPRLALDDAYARLTQLGPRNALRLVPEPTPFAAAMPRMDPAFESAVCRYDLSRGALRVRVPITSDYTSVSFYTRHGLAYYALNDRSAGRRLIELELMTSAQRAALPEDEDITAADRLIVESPTIEGIVYIRALVRERGARGAVRAGLNEASCAPAA